jgi:hypothetical protein
MTLKRSKYAEFALKYLNSVSLTRDIIFADIPRGILFTNVLAKNNLGFVTNQTYTVELFGLSYTRTFGTLKGAKKFIAKQLAKLYFVYLVRF